MVGDYLTAEFVSPEEVELGRGAGVKVSSPYYPATEISFASKA